MPNVSGFAEFGAKVWWGTGILFNHNNNSDGLDFGKSSPDSLKIDLSRGSNQYQNNLKEVRVKSIISNGFIKLY